MSLVLDRFAVVALGSCFAACASATGTLTTHGDADGGVGEVDASTADAPSLPDSGLVLLSDAATPADAAIAIADATPPPVDAVPTSIDAGCTPTVVDLLVNPDFELGPASGWQQSSSNGWDLIVSVGDADPYPIAPHDGNYGAWLAGDTYEDSILYQDVAIPDSATGLTITGYYQISTQEVDGTADLAYLDLRDSFDALIEPLAEWSNQDVTTGWRSFSYIPTGDYAGRTIRVYFEGMCDGSAALTSFFFDSLELSATVCL